MTQATNPTLKTRRLAADAAGIAEAARMLGAGALVAFPTETVYGLGALASDPVAVARLFAAKARPSFNPLIAHVLDVASARRLGEFDTNAERLAAKCWPGALTLVVRAAAELLGLRSGACRARYAWHCACRRTRWRARCSRRWEIL